VLVTPQSVRLAESEPHGPVMYLLEQLAARYVAVTTVSQGDVRSFGSARWTWLHPQRRSHFENANNGSMVVRVEAAGRRVLLAGDIQREAMEQLSAADITADIVELPHHGSHHDYAEAFLARVGPQVVLQSTGASRWQRTRDRWMPAIGETEWLVTARDGACRVEIDRDGSTRVECYRGGEKRNLVPFF
jgi:competence protein ComEC